MPLLLPTLQAELISIYEKGPAGNPSPLIVGIKTGKAYMTFVQPGINAGAGSTIGMFGAAALGAELGEILSFPNSDGSITAQKIAKEVDACLQTYISLFQTTIVTTSGLPGLISDLTDIFSKPKGASSLFAMAFARALNTFTASAVVIGIIPGVPPIPFSGPIG